MMQAFSLPTLYHSQPRALPWASMDQPVRLQERFPEDKVPRRHVPKGNDNPASENQASFQPHSRSPGRGVFCGRGFQPRSPSERKRGFQPLPWKRKEFTKLFYVRTHNQQPPAGLLSPTGSLILARGKTESIGRRPGSHVKKHIAD